MGRLKVTEIHQACMDGWVEFGLTLAAAYEPGSRAEAELIMMDRRCYIGGEEFVVTGAVVTHDDAGFARITVDVVPRNPIQSIIINVALGDELDLVPWSKLPFAAEDPWAAAA